MIFLSHYNDLMKNQSRVIFQILAMEWWLLLNFKILFTCQSMINLWRNHLQQKSSMKTIKEIFKLSIQTVTSSTDALNKKENNRWRNLRILETYLKAQIWVSMKRTAIINLHPKLREYLFAVYSLIWNKSLTKMIYS